MNSRTYLASMQRRLAAFVVDAMLLIPALAIIAEVTARLPNGVPIALVAFSVVFVAYHWVGLANGKYAIGRMIAAIEVVSTRSGPTLSDFQCMARPVIRVIWQLVGLLVAMFSHQLAPLFVPLLVDILLLMLHPQRQTVADLACGTTVVRTPPLQPHRAPAGPMFSDHDAEFGLKPHRK